MKRLQIGGEPGVVLVLAEQVEPLTNRLGELVTGEALEIVEDFFGPGEGSGSLGDREEDMEVIGHEGVGEDLHATKPLAFPHEGEEVLFLGGIENELPVHDAGKTVVEAGGMILGNLQSGCPHGGRRLITADPSVASLFYKGTGK
jgi:hypothetical protein